MSHFEDSKKKADEIENEERVKSTRKYIIHKINNPLTAILANADFLFDQFADSDVDPKISSAIKGIIDSAEDIRKQVQHICGSVTIEEIVKEMTTKKG